MKPVIALSRSFSDANGQFRGNPDPTRATASDYSSGSGSAGLKAEVPPAIDPVLSPSMLFGGPTGIPPSGPSNPPRPPSNPLNPYGGGMGGTKGGMGGLNGGMGLGGLDQGRTASGNSMEEPQHHGMGPDGNNQAEGGPEDSVKQRERNRNAQKRFRQRQKVIRLDPARSAPAASWHKTASWWPKPPPQLQ